MKFAGVEPYRNISSKVRQIEFVAIGLDVGFGVGASESLVAVILVWSAVTQGGIHLNLFLRHFGNDVHDCPHRIGSVQYGRGTTDNLNAFNIGYRNTGIIDVTICLTGHALTVDQKQYITGIETLEGK